jgi:hypothetical protein
MYKNEYTESEKKAIAELLKPVDLAKAAADYKRMASLFRGGEEGLCEIKPLSPIGLTFIETFVYYEVLNTVCKQGINFYDFWFHRDFYMHRDASTERLVASIQKNRAKLSEIKVAKQVYNLYYGGINLFRPLNAFKLYKAYHGCRRVLDPTMGWGGRMVAAYLADHVESYTGIDCNLALQKPYASMLDFMKKQEGDNIGVKEDIRNEKVVLHFCDAVTFDYSGLDYDMVFTSPPFYNKEIYSHNTLYKTKADWDEHFYVPLFTKTWAHLKAGGIYALNVPEILYTRVATQCLGREADEKIELAKYGRFLPKTTKKRTNVGQSYKEYIYVWKKNT